MARLKYFSIKLSKQNKNFLKKYISLKAKTEHNFDVSTAFNKSLQKK